MDISLDTYQKFNVFTHAVLREAVVAMHGCGSSVTLLDHSRVDKLCCHDIVSWISLKKCLGQGLNLLTKWGIQVTGEDIISDFPRFPGLQQRYTSCNLCVIFSVYTLLSGYLYQDIYIELYHSSQNTTHMEILDF